MSESEIAGKVTRLVKAADKLVQNVKKDISSVLEAAAQLKSVNKSENEKEQDGDQH